MLSLSRQALALGVITLMVLVLAVCFHDGGIVQSERLNRLLQRRFPGVSYNDQGCIFAALSLLVAFVMGLLTMYALLEMF